MSNKDTALEVFEAGIEAGDGRDAIIVAMVQQGCTLNSAQNWYKEFSVSAGIASSRIGHKKEAMEYINASGVDLLDDEARSQLKADLVEEFGVATSTANDYVKAYAADNDIELPRSNFGSNPEEQEKIFNWIVAHKDCDKSEFKEFMVSEMGRSSGSIDETWRGIVLARALQVEGVVFGE